MLEMLPIERTVRTGLFRLVPIFVLAAVLFAFTAGAVSFLLYALYARLTLTMSMVPAALWTAAFAFGVAVLIAGLVMLTIKYADGDDIGDGRAARGRDNAAALQAALGTSADWIGKHPAAAGLTAFAAGLILGFNPKLTDQLAGGLADFLGKTNPKA